MNLKQSIDVTIDHDARVPGKQPTQTLTDYADILADWFTMCNARHLRKARGQYFTPKVVSEFMVQLIDFSQEKPEFNILDPGAGTGIFESAICDYLVSTNQRLHVSFDLYEDSLEMIALLDKNMRECKNYMAKNGHEISYRIINENFILANPFDFQGFKGNPSVLKRNSYDLVISNPPYKKLKKDTPESLVMQRITKGQPNIYVFFMAMATTLLNHKGQCIFLTPRSYCTGEYFKVFRNWFFEHIIPVRFHEFESRRLLKRDSVLQEMLIMKGIKGIKRPTNIIISKSDREPSPAKMLICREIPFSTVMSVQKDAIRIRIPSTPLDERIVEIIDSFPKNLISLGLRASTGKVVPFRVEQEFLSTTVKTQRSAPLFWMENIRNGKVVWPLKLKDKPISLLADERTKRLCIPNSNYVLVKRFSSKEGKKRINAGAFLSEQSKFESIAIENHINYIHKTDAKLSKFEAIGLTELLNSVLYNKYSQIANGSTQVDSSELNSIPLPEMASIIKIGKISTDNKLEGQILQKRILQILNIDTDIFDKQTLEQNPSLEVS